MTEEQIKQSRKRQPASIELVVLGLLAALIVVLAIPLLSQATNSPNQTQTTQESAK